MAFNYQFTDPFQLPGSTAAALPPELGGDFLATLNRQMDLQDQQQTTDLLGSQEQRGLLRSGDTNYELVKQILGPSEDRRRQALLGVAVPAAEQGQAQHFQQQFSTQQNQQRAQLALQNQLAEMEKQFEYTKNLAFLQNQLERDMPSNRPSFSDIFKQGFASNLGGNALGIGAGLLGGFLI